MILALMNLTTVFGTFLRTENQAALQTSSEWFWNSDVDCGNLSTRFFKTSHLKLTPHFKLISLFGSSSANPSFAFFARGYLPLL